MRSVTPLLAQQHNLSLTPDAQPTACLLPALQTQTTYGTVDGAHLSINTEALEELRRRTTQDSPACTSCFAREHCARQCPHHCPLVGPPTVDPARCHEIRQIAMIQLLEHTQTPFQIEDLEALSAVGLGPDRRVGVRQ